ncbi:phosphonate utilization associated transcriptional regulator [Cupriavidus pinatubonensis]|uniref:D-xylose utilization operon transcriptional repressor n=1 Tax=Cupriavidus pinatubonensis TaxID=248026 RepID=A0ABM8WZR3_9BURK|nr:phosphonate utilization associated transcriptional regulator [Cupriavidus pinatubonensis]CAG9173069.1 putative D-xylose utilization operon transcriptional repressor [Cupriavidus pinatubonensis]
MSIQAPLASEISILQSQSLTTLVQRELETRIMSGGLVPGAKLNEIEVAGQLNVSRGPVREAFRALEQAGLLRMEKNRGVFVRAISLQEADEIYELRAVLDEHVGRALAARATAEGVRELRAFIEGLARASTDGDVDAYARLNLRFHDRMVELTGNGKLVDTYRRLVKELALFRREALSGNSAAMPDSTREHREIVSAIAARDADLAGRLMREHVERGRARLHAAVAPAQANA